MKKFVCDYPWTHFEINNPNGDVTVCCDNNTVVGNINDGSIEDIWNGEGYRDFRQRMTENGAHILCPHSCPVLQGRKKFQDLEINADEDVDADIRANAELNRQEFTAGKTTLDSMPRWMRFTYSYACNLDCYHCYQRDDAMLHHKLPMEFLKNMEALSKYYQVIFPFGGEPFLYRPILDFLETHELPAGQKYYFISNATLFTPRVRKVLEEKEILTMAISMDAATPESFDILRLRGANASWESVLESLRWLKELKRKKGFLFTTSMTLNSVNFDEIERFVDIGIEHDAEPLILLVANPDQTLDFQRQFLRFTDEQFETMRAQIDRSMNKVVSAGFPEAKAALEIVKRSLDKHQVGDNNLIRFSAKNSARRALSILPKGAQRHVKDVIQRARLVLNA